MIEYLAKRIIMLVPVIFFITVISFMIIYITPGDPAINALRSPSGGVDQQSVDEYRAKMGLDQPIYIQYLRWIERVFHGDFGYSYMTSSVVSTTIWHCFISTFKLAIVSMALSLAVALPAGIISAVWHNTIIDHISRLFALIGVSIPNFWLAYLLMIIFGLTLRVLPTSGYGDGGDLSHIILPAVTLGAVYIAVTMRMTRSSMLEVLGQEYIKGAKAKGLKKKAIIIRHALKNALIPVVTVAGLNFGYLLNGSVIVETVFGWPGIGKLVVSSIMLKDYPMVQGCILFIAIIYVLVNLGVDILYVFVNPRIRYGTIN